MLLNLILLTSLAIGLAQDGSIRVEMTKGKGSTIIIICDPISAAGPGYNPDSLNKWGKAMYFCKDPCGWQDVYGGNQDAISAGLLTKAGYTSLSGHSGRMMSNLIKFNEITENVKTKLKVTLSTGSDGATQWGENIFCVWWTAGADTYVPIEITMVDPQPKTHRLSELINHTSIPEEEDAELEKQFNLHHEDTTISHSRIQCEGNRACMLSLLGGSIH